MLGMKIAITGMDDDRAFGACLELSFRLTEHHSNSWCPRLYGVRFDETWMQQGECNVNLEKRCKTLHRPQLLTDAKSLPDAPRGRGGVCRREICEIDPLSHPDILPWPVEAATGSSWRLAAISPERCGITPQFFDVSVQAGNERQARTRIARERFGSVLAGVNQGVFQTCGLWLASTFLNLPRSTPAA
jgi:hypothetical protein